MEVGKLAEGNMKKRVVHLIIVKVVFSFIDILCLNLTGCSFCFFLSFFFGNCDELLCVVNVLLL